MIAHEDAIDEENFERMVFPICRQVFSPLIKKEKENYKIPDDHDDVEYDGLYETEFVVHAVEITVSKKIKKFRQDMEKLKRRIESIERQISGQKSVQGWMITKYDATSDQKEARKNFSTGIPHLVYLR